MVLPSFLTSLLDNLSALFTSQNPFTWLDYIVFVIFLFYAVQGFSIGFIESFTELISFALSFTFGLKLYGIVGKLLILFRLDLRMLLDFLWLQPSLRLYLKSFLVNCFPGFLKFLGLTGLKHLHLQINCWGFSRELPVRLFYFRFFSLF